VVIAFRDLSSQKIVARPQLWAFGIPFDDRDVHRTLVIGHDDLDDGFAWKEERAVSVKPDAAMRPGAVYP
jgi:hypothetical protein